jgi:Bacterial regulatory protein, arsR family
VTELSASLGLRSAQTSHQLSELRRAGLVRSQRRGRHRIYSGDADTLARLLDVLGEVVSRSGPRSPESSRARTLSGHPDRALREARTCYDHLAGAAGVDLAVEMVRAGWLVAGQADFLLTERGERELARRGVDVGACREARRKLAPGCLDWTERRPHVGGSLGRAILLALEGGGYLEVAGGRRVVLHRPVGGWVGAARPSGARLRAGGAGSGSSTAWAPVEDY